MDSTEYLMPLPALEITATTLHALLEAINTAVRTSGYSMVIARSKRTQATGPINRAIIACSMHGQYRSTRKIEDTMRKRPNRVSMRCGCPMQLSAFATDEGLWSFKYQCMHHNHEPVSDASAHKIHRTISTAERQEIVHHAKVGTRPRNMLAALKQKNPSSKVILQDIYNEVARSKRDGLKELNVAEALQQGLQDDAANYFWEMTTDVEGRIENLFLAKTSMIEAFKDHHEVLILDCTYKTNAYQMPLLNIVGVTGANTTLQVAVVFLQSEEEASYQWALRVFKRMKEQHQIPDAVVCFTDQEVALINALEVVFPETPTLLCLWHIMKNVSAYAKKHGMPDVVMTTDAGHSKRIQSLHPGKTESTKFTAFMSSFGRCISVPTEVEFNISLEKMRMLSPVVTQYIESQYLGIWKHKVAACFTRDVVTFGITTTSRGEGSHSAMKSWLSLSKSDIHEFWSKMNLLWKQQHDQYCYIMARAGSTVSSGRQTPFWAAVNRRIHVYPLQEALKQWEKRTEDSICSGQYTKKTGIPCRHSIARLIGAGHILRCAHFHQHWWVRRSTILEQDTAEQQLILPPRTLKDLRAERAAEKRLHQKGKGPTGNRRALSAFELTTSARNCATWESNHSDLTDITAVLEEHETAALASTAPLPVLEQNSEGQAYAAYIGYCYGS